MPNLKQLLDELRELRVDPKQIRIPGPLYDELIDQAEDEIDDEE